MQVVGMVTTNTGGIGAVNDRKREKKDRECRQKSLDFPLQFHVHDFKF